MRLAVSVYRLIAGTQNKNGLQFKTLPLQSIKKKVHLQKNKGLEKGLLLTCRIFWLSEIGLPAKTSAQPCVKTCCVHSFTTHSGVVKLRYNAIT